VRRWQLDISLGCPSKLDVCAAGSKRVARGASLRHIGERFNCSPDVVWRHWRNGRVPEHVKSQPAIRALKPGEILERPMQDESIDLLENLQRIRATLYASFDAAAEVGDRQAVSLRGCTGRS
jgi:hypothetical protein